MAYDSNAPELREQSPSTPEKPLDSLERDTGAPGEKKTLTSREEGALLSPPAMISVKKQAATTNREDLLAVGAGREPSEEHIATQKTNKEEEPSCRERRIRVGFLSAFFRHHSVGLLVEGVVTRLDRRRFETTAIFLQPQQASTSTASPGKPVRDGGSTDSDDGTVGDGVYKAVRSRTEHVLDVPANR